MQTEILILPYSADVFEIVIFYWHKKEDLLELRYFAASIPLFTPNQFCDMWQSHGLDLYCNFAWSIRLAHVTEAVRLSSLLAKDNTDFCSSLSSVMSIVLLTGSVLYNLSLINLVFFPQCLEKTIHVESIQVYLKVQIIVCLNIILQYSPYANRNTNTAL